MKLGFSGQIFEKKNPQIQNLVKISKVETELFHVKDGQTSRS